MISKHELNSDCGSVESEFFFFFSQLWFIWSCEFNRIKSQVAQAFTQTHLGVGGVQRTLLYHLLLHEQRLEVTFHALHKGTLGTAGDEGEASHLSLSLPASSRWLGPPPPLQGHWVGLICSRFPLLQWLRWDCYITVSSGSQAWHLCQLWLDPRHLRQCSDRGAPAE